jgi:hypothetical protein
MFKLSDDQSECFELLKKFVNEPIHNSFLLTGSAGTGKTEVISRIADISKKRFIFLSPTKKACNVLEQSLAKKGLSCRVNTLHSFLGYSHEYDNDGNEIFSTNKLEIKKKVSRYSKYNPILCIDECGMISNEMFEFILLYQALSKCLIIFIGDICQLPPIYTCKCKTNLCVNKCIPTNKFSLTFNNTGFNLKQVMRTDNPKLLKLNSIFRTIVQDHDEGTCSDLNKIIKKNDIITLSEKEFKKQMIISASGRNDTILAFTNRRVKYYNDYMLYILFPDRKTDFVEGMKIIFNSQSYTSYCDEHTYSPHIPTSSTFIVDSCSINNVKYSGENFDVNDVFITVDTCCSGKQSIKIRKVTVDDSKRFYKKKREIKKQLEKKIKSLDKKDVKKISAYWREFYETSGLLNEPFNVAYATTIHKSQGSTYENVFVDMEEIESICKDRNLFLKYRLLYTAVSRASHNCQIRWFKPIEYLFEYSESELDSDSDSD